MNNGHTDLLKKNKNRVQLECHVPPTSVFSIGFEVDVGSWEIDVIEANCQQYFSETGTSTELKWALRLLVKLS